MNNKNIVALRTGLTEDARIRALKRYRIAGTPPEEIFDHYVQMATLIFKMPAAVIAFVDSEAVHYKASIGIGGQYHSKSYQLNCVETIHRTTKKGLYTVSLAGAAYTFYVGVPIYTADGFAIGCLSLLDHHHHKLNPEQQLVLKLFASGIMDAVEDRLQQLQEKERKYWLTQSTHEGLWEWNIAQDKMWWSPGFSRLFGYPAVSDTIYDQDFWCSRFDSTTSEEIKSTMLAGVLNGEYRFKRKDNTLAHVLIRSEVVRDEFGQPVKIIGYMMDKSEQFDHEELNRKTHLELLRYKDEFISTASHEIKTPITIIKSYSQLIGREVIRYDYQNTQLAMYANRIQKQTDKLINLVENLLDISRINFGKMIIYPEVFDLAKLLEQLIDELDNGVDRHRIEKKGEASLMVYADKFRIGQVLTNLISNAVKYSPAADRVIVRYHQKKNYAKIAVEDFGPGITPKNQAKLFQKFYRITDMSADKVPGTGLGLNIAMEIVQQHGSSITLHSARGKGSVFSFDLPLVPNLSPKTLATSSTGG